MKKKFFIGILVFITSTIVSAQNVGNIEASVTSDNKIAVQYQITGAKYYQTFNIALYVSLDGGKSWEGPLKEVSGDVGKNIEDGKKRIYWDFLNEIPVINENLIFDVRAEVIEEKVPNSFFISYIGNDVTYLGARIGLLGKTGFYIEGRMSPIAFDSPAYTFKDGTIEDYQANGYYEFTKANGWSAFSGIAGLTFQAGRDFFIYTGAGYAWERYLYTIDEYTYDPPKKSGEAFVKYDEYSTTGVEIDAGFMLRSGNLLFSGGATALNFDTFNWSAGIGVSF